MFLPSSMAQGRTLFQRTQKRLSYHGHYPRLGYTWLKHLCPILCAENIISMENETCTTMKYCNEWAQNSTVDKRQGPAPYTFPCKWLLGFFHDARSEPILEDADRQPVCPVNDGSTFGVLRKPNRCLLWLSRPVFRAHGQLNTVLWNWYDCDDE